MSLRGREARGHAVVERSVIKRSRLARGVERANRVREFFGIETEFPGECFERVRLRARKHRWHEAADGFGVDDRVADLPRLLGHETAPDRVTLRPKVFAFVVEALGVLVDDDTERNAIDSRDDAAVVERCARVNGHAMRLARVADHVRASVHHVFEQHTLVETRSANQKVVGGPFAGVVLAPCFTQPFTVRFKAAGREHTSFGNDALVANVRGQKTVAIQFYAICGCVVTNLHAEQLSATVIRVDQRFTAAHEERVGAREMQRARQ